MTADGSSGKRALLADAFDRTLDPLAEFEATFRDTDVDPFDLFVTEVLPAKDVTPRTREGYRRVVRQWRAYVDECGRHPACPAVEHVRGFMRREYDDRGNHPDTIAEKVRKLREIYRYWQADPAFPHPDDYDPFSIATRTTSFEPPAEKRVRCIPLPELRRTIADVDHLRDVAIIVLQLKLGLRATELCNIALGELDVQNHELQRHYPELGDHWLLADRPNALYVPHDRFGNKSSCPRVLPLDAEARAVVTEYLLIRPDTGLPWVFLSNKGNSLTKEAVNRAWRRVFHPEYAETDYYRGVTSHYGRHFFTTYWRVERGLDRPRIQYLRGDGPGSESITGRAGIDEYIHTQYRHIEETYRSGVFQLDIDERPKATPRRL
jgi:integrase/recombinase XerD